MGPLNTQLDRAAEEEGRDPSGIERTLDVYSVVPEGHSPAGLDMEYAFAGRSQKIGEQLLELGELGFNEVRCDVWPSTVAAIESMIEVVQLIHQG